MSAHREAGDAQWAQSVAFAPVEEDEALQHETTAHHKDIRDVLQTRAPEMRGDRRHSVQISTAFGFQLTAILLMGRFPGAIKRILEDYAADVSLLHQRFRHKVSSLPEILHGNELKGIRD